MTFTIYSVLNLTSAIIDFIAIIICIIFLSIIIYHLIWFKSNENRLRIDIPLILCINILCVLIIKVIIQTIHITIPTIKNDFYSLTKSNETFYCQYPAYFLWSLIGVQYWIYTLLVFFRFTRVIYPTYLWLQQISFYIRILIPSQYIFVFLSVLIIVLSFNCIHLLSDEVYCDVSVRPFSPVASLGIITFGIPFTIICIFYILIIRKMRYSTRIQHHRRDYAVIRRILFHTIILSIVSIPGDIIIIIYNIDEQYEKLSHRIIWLTSSLATILFSSILPLITTHLQKIFIERN